MSKKFKFWVNTIYIFIRHVLSLLIITPISVLFHCWYSLITGISTRQTFLNLGSQFLKAGAGVKIGDPQKIPLRGGKVRTSYIKNIFFNFGLNKITVSYTDKPHTVRK